MAGLLERLRPLVTPEQLVELEEQIRSAPVHPIFLVLAQGLIAGISINALAAFGEELGWRGFLHRSWKQRGYWRTSLLIGGIWGLWHAPIILMGHNYPEHPVAGVFMMVLFTLLWSPIFFYIREKSGSVIAAAILHGSINASAGLAILLVQGGSDLTVGIAGLSGLIVLLLANAVLVWFDRKWAAEPIIGVPLSSGRLGAKPGFQEPPQP